MSETTSLPPRDREYRVTWVSLLRTIRAPLAILILAGIALLVPPQTAEMLAALEDGRRSLGDTFWFHVALAFLALSAWYWSRALPGCALRHAGQSCRAQCPGRRPDRAVSEWAAAQDVPEGGPAADLRPGAPPDVCPGGADRAGDDYSLRRLVESGLSGVVGHTAGFRCLLPHRPDAASVQVPGT